MFGGVKRAGHALFGGMFDNQPGAFSQHDGGLQALLGSFHDGQPGNRLTGQGVPAPQADPWQAMLALNANPQAPVPAPQRKAEAPRKGPGFMRTLGEYLDGDGTWDESKLALESRDDFRTKRAELDQRFARMNPSDPEWIAMQLAPEKLGGAYASGMEQRTLGRNDLDLFRGQVRNVNDAAPDPVLVDKALVDGRTGEVIYQAPQFEQWDPTKNVVQTRPGVGGVPAPRAPAGGFDSFYDGFLAPAEGGYAARDGKSGAPANFGINQAANPDVDVASLTREQAKQLAFDRYWKPSGADQLPSGLAEVHADTAFNMGLGAADALLKQSGGDPQRYLALREARYRELAKDPGHAPNLPGWLDRNAKLAQFVGGQGRPQAQPQAPGVPKIVSPARPSMIRMSAEEVKAAGLSPGTVAYMDDKGKPVVVDKLDDAERQNAAFAYRGIQGLEKINALAEKGVYKPSAQLEWVDPLFGEAGFRIRNATDRQFVQAAKEFLAPILRKDTGAAVTDTELATYMDIYIPRASDDPDTLRQKAQARAAAMRGLIAESGGGYAALFPDAPKLRSLYDPKGAPKPQPIPKLDQPAESLTREQKIAFLKSQGL